GKGASCARSSAPTSGSSLSQRPVGRHCTSSPEASPSPPRSATSCWCRSRRSPSAMRRRSGTTDRKSTRLNASHVSISYAISCSKKKTEQTKADEETAAQAEAEQARAEEEAATEAEADQAKADDEAADQEEAEQAKADEEAAATA